MVNNIKQKLSKDIQLKALLSGSAVVLMFKILGAFSSYVFFYLLAKNLGAEGVGLFSLCITLLSVLVMLSKLGLDSLIVKQIPEYKAKGVVGAEGKLYKKLLGIVLVFSMLLSTTVYFSAELVATFFQNTALVSASKIIALAILPSVLLSMNAESLRGLEQMKYFSYLQNGSIMMLSVLLLLLAYLFNKQGINTPIYVYSIAVCILAFVSLYLLAKKIPKQGERISTPNLKSTLKLALPMLVSGAVFMIMNWTDVLMLGYYSDEGQVGIYNLCFKLASIITFAQFAINSYAAPRISSYFHAEKHLELKSLISKIAWLNLIIALPFFLVLFIYGGQILPIFGAEFAEGSSVLLFLIIGQLVNALSGPVLYILNMTGKEVVARNIVLAAAVLNLVLNYILIPLYGIEGAAIAATLSMIVWNLGALIYIYKNYGILTVAYFNKN